jgi:hypothetical protein
MVMSFVGWHGQSGGPVEGPVDGPVGVRVEGVAILPAAWGALQEGYWPSSLANRLIYLNG